MSEPGFWDLLAALGVPPDLSDREHGAKLHLITVYGAAELLRSEGEKDAPTVRRCLLWLALEQAVLAGEAIDRWRLDLPSGDEFDRLVHLEVWRLRLWDDLLGHARRIAPAAFTSKRRALPRRLARGKGAK